MGFLLTQATYNQRVAVGQEREGIYHANHETREFLRVEFDTLERVDDNCEALVGEEHHQVR